MFEPCFANFVFKKNIVYRYHKHYRSASLFAICNLIKKQISCSSKDDLWDKSILNMCFYKMPHPCIYIKSQIFFCIVGYSNCPIDPNTEHTHTHVFFRRGYLLTFLTSCLSITRYKARWCCIQPALAVAHVLNHQIIDFISTKKEFYYNYKYRLKSRIQSEYYI